MLSQVWGMNEFRVGARKMEEKGKDHTAKGPGPAPGGGSLPRVALVQGAGREEEVGLVGKCCLETMEGFEGS